MRVLLSFLIAVFLMSPAMAQDSLPDMPERLQALIDRGAQARYLGRAHGLDGWIIIFQGQEEYYYVLPDGEAFLMGILFDKEGIPVTIEQVQALQAQEDDVLNMMAEATKPDNQTRRETIEPFEFKTPAQRMFVDVQNSNWIAFGNPNAPVIYSFMDPQCPHCHDFMQDLRKGGFIARGEVQVRMIPVGFREDTLAQAAFLLASPDAQERFFQHLDGDQSAIPAKFDINNQGVQKNLALMQAWKFNVTPMSIYEDKSGEVKLIRGRAKDIPGILSDIK